MSSSEPKPQEHPAAPPPEETKSLEPETAISSEPTNAVEVKPSEVAEPLKVVEAPKEAEPSKATEPPKPEPPKQAAVEEAPDPEEDDLDDLDDVLDEFAAHNISSNSPFPKSTSTSTGPGRPAPEISSIPSLNASDPFAFPSDGLLPDDDEFARSLQAGMAELLGGLESNPEMQKQFEELVKELGEGTLTATSAGADPSSSEAKDIPFAIPSATTPGAGGEAAKQTTAEAQKADASFQEQIRLTMERMSASSASATEATTSASSNQDDFLASLLAEMEKGVGDPSALLGAAAGGDEDFSKLLLGMMEQLTNKDILYEPMKELHDKFPAWMEANKETCDKGDLARYVEQQKLVGEIVGKFEDKGYSDGKVEYREFIVDKMQKMQAAGSPPPDLVGDMNAAQEAMEGMDQGCAQQ